MTQALEEGALVDAEPVAWDDPPRSAAQESAPILSVEGFEGPLDWLLEMVRARKIDLARLPILALVTAFGAALESALAARDHAAGQRAAPLGRWGDWLVMATHLAYLRSRLLLPTDAVDAQAAADAAEVLRRQLVTRAAIRAAADWLESRSQLHREVFPRGRIAVPGAGRVGDITGLLRACLAALQLPEGTEPYRPRPPPVWRVSDAIARISALLGLVPEEGSPLAAFLPPIDDAAPQTEFRCRAAVATTLLASLELARDGTVALDQPRPWAPILLHRAPAGTELSRTG